MPALLRAPALRLGDTVAIVAPASGLAPLVPHRLEKAKRELEELGLRVRIYPSVTRTAHENALALREKRSDCLDSAIYGAPNRYSSADAIIRAEELMDAFKDESVRAIICSIGGFTSHELLEYLDFSVITANPKIFSGFSDITSLHLALYSQTGLCTFYGPAALTQFGEFPAPLAYTMRSFWQAVSSVEPLGEIVASAEWTENTSINWLTKADITHQSAMKPNAGYKWLRLGSGTGRLLGGCLPVLLNVRGSRFMPDLDGAVLLLETPEGHSFDVGMTLGDVNAVLGCLRLDGTFGKIHGLVLGRAFAYSDEEVAELERLVLYHTRGTSFPILYGLDCGHTNPIATLPLGCEVELDAARNALRVLESGVTTGS